MAQGSDTSPDDSNAVEGIGRATAGGIVTVGGIGASLTVILINTAQKLAPEDWFRLAALLLATVVVIFGLGVVAVGVGLVMFRPSVRDDASATDRSVDGAAILLLTGLALVIVGAISIAIDLLLG